MGTFDRDSLHAILAALPAGRWTSYGDLAGVVGTGGMALGSHLKHCEQCLHPWRVLGDKGVPAEGFAWSDPSDTRSQRDVLEAEGVTFVQDAADPSLRLTVEELRSLGA